MRRPLNSGAGDARADGSVDRSTVQSKRCQKTIAMTGSTRMLTVKPGRGRQGDEELRIVGIGA